MASVALCLLHHDSKLEKQDPCAVLLVSARPAHFDIAYSVTESSCFRHSRFLNCKHALFSIVANLNLTPHGRDLRTRYHTPVITSGRTLCDTLKFALV